jgi:hypothetical protein
MQKFGFAFINFSIDAVAVSACAFVRKVFKPKKK